MIFNAIITVLNQVKDHRIIPTDDKILGLKGKTLNRSSLRLLKNNNPESQLYGKYYYMIFIDRFSKELSREFLKKGFEEAKISVSDETIERAVEVLNGIPRWFTFFGNRCASGYIDIETAFNITVELAVRN